METLSVKITVSLGLMLYVVFFSMGAISAVWWYFWSEARFTLKTTQKYLRASTEIIRELKESVERSGTLAEKIRKAHLTDVVLPLADILIEAVRSGKLNPKTQSYAFLKSLLPLWASEDRLFELYRAIDYIEDMDLKGFKITVSWFRDQVTRKKLIFMLELTHTKLDKPFKQTCVFTL